MKKSEIKTHVQETNIAAFVLLNLLENFNLILPQEAEEKIQELINFLYDNYYPGPTSENEIELEETELLLKTSYREVLD